MDSSFKEHITKNIACAEMGGGRNLAIFCHFDAGNIISDYVVHYVKALRDAGCDVAFVSNSNPDDEQLSKINNIVNQIVLRKNIGYDFAAYFTGYVLHRNNLSKYKHVMFINDSVFGPFYPLAGVIEKMSAKGFDMWGMSDAFHKHYHIQSYFWAFRTDAKVLDILDDEARNYKFHLPKKDIVGMYEEGVTARMMKAGMKLGVFCSNAEAINFEMTQTEDEELKQLKADMVRIGKAKQSLGRKIKALFSVKTNRAVNFTVPDANAYLTGMNSCWYSMIKYFGMPFIKVSLLKSEGNFRYHGFRYIGVLKQKYPDFDWTLIENHLNRVKSKQR